MKLEVCAFIIVQWGVKAVRLCFLHFQNLKLLFIRLLLCLFLSFVVFPFSPPPLHLLSQTLLFSSLAMRQLIFYVLFLTCIRIFFIWNISVAHLHLLCCAFDFLCLQHIFPRIRTWLSSSATHCCSFSCLLILPLHTMCKAKHIFWCSLSFARPSSSSNVSQGSYWVHFVSLFSSPPSSFFFFSVYISLLYLTFSWF